MIEMSMCEQDGFDGLRREVQFPDEPSDEKRFANHSRVNHHAVVAGVQQKAATHEAANVVKAGRTIAHAPFITGFWAGDEFKNAGRKRQRAGAVQDAVARFRSAGTLPGVIKSG